MAKRVTFESTEELPNGERGNHVLIGCTVEWDYSKSQWRAFNEHGDEAWADYSNLAALMLFVAFLTPSSESEDD